MSRRADLAQIASGAAALAVIAAVSRVNALALPQYTLVLTAAVATAVALVSVTLPEPHRRGPALGALVGAALTALVVVVSVAGTTAATIRAEVTPAIWAADVTAFADAVRTTNWQLPAAAMLLAVLGVAVAPRLWRWDAIVAGGFVVILAVPGTGAVAWWMVPLLAAVGSAVATAAALVAVSGRGALLRTVAAGLLGLYAVATGLARPELTAAVAALLTLIAAGTVVLSAGWPGRFGPYADRVADAAGGAAAFTLPLAVGTFAWLLAVPASLLVPLTLFAVAIGVLGAALGQAAAPSPLVASAGGAMAASVAGLVLALQADGAVVADIGLAVLLLVTAATTAAARAFEISGNGLLAGLRSVPTAVGAYVDAVEDVDRPPEQGRPRTRRVDGTTAAAALSVAALILSMSRLAAVAVPGIGLVTTSAMVLVVALGVRLLPPSLRTGPRLGAGSVGGTIVVVVAAIAVLERGARSPRRRRSGPPTSPAGPPGSPPSPRTAGRFRRA
jgi:hypothetical protein